VPKAAKPTPRAPTKPRPAVISRAAMARMLQVSPAAVTQACRPGKPLYEARSGHGIDVTHEAAVRMLAAKAGQRQQLQRQLDDPKAPVGVELPGEPEEPEPEPVEAAQSVDEISQELGPWRAQVGLASLVEPLATLTQMYGDARVMSHWVQTRKHLAAAMREEMLLARVAGRLIARTTVDRMIEKIDSAFRLMLSDAPRTIATRIDPGNMVATSAIVRDQLEQILKACQAMMLDSLKADDPMAPLTEATAAE
jgi:hypothetical protein